MEATGDEVSNNNFYSFNKSLDYTLDWAAPHPLLSQSCIYKDCPGETETTRIQTHKALYWNFAIAGVFSGSIQDDREQNQGFYNDMNQGFYNEMSPPYNE